MNKVGLIGVGVMGRNLALNLGDQGIGVVLYDRRPESVAQALAEAAGRPLSGTTSLRELVTSLERPRCIIILVPAGPPVDGLIAELRQLLQGGDILIDAGNELYSNTERRERQLVTDGIRYLGMGVSGGAEGARHGPSLMPGGERGAYDLVAPMLAAIAAKVDDGPCVAYMGPGGAGHYVKMVHNGIEYGDMQLIAEAYDLLRHVGGLSLDELAEVFRRWNLGELQSYLIEITAQILPRLDPLTGKPLLDMIRDRSGMKGTGSWTVEQAAALPAAIPTIGAALDARILSSLVERSQAAAQLLGPKPVPSFIDRQQLIEDTRQALYASKLCTYAQGMRLLAGAAKEYEWPLDLGEVARIWRGGCIIRARLLGAIRDAFAADAALPNLLLAPTFTTQLGERQTGWRRIIALGVQHGLPLPAIGAAVAYYDGLRRERLPACLIQAQRDFFGAHTYERSDRDGTFHTEWTS